jgi:hypothetical protein
MNRRFGRGNAVLSAARPLQVFNVSVELDFRGLTGYQNFGGNAQRQFYWSRS